MYTAGSLFSGIGGIDLAFSRAGFDVRWQVEIEPYCRAVLTKHSAQYWPNAVQHEDVKNVGRHNLQAVDVIFGGFPCQDISVAGKGAGIKEGTRSGLWFEFARIIGELRPSFVFLENVSAITRRGADIVSGTLSQMGYCPGWIPVPASTVGAPHKRDRWFCVAYANTLRRHESATIKNSALDQNGELPPLECEGSAVVYASVASRETMAYAGSSRLEGSGNGTLSDGEALAIAADNGSDVGNSIGNRLEGDNSQRIGTEGSGVASQIGRAYWSIPNDESGIFERPSARAAFGITQSVLGRAVDGLSRQLDSTRWPARPNEPQYAWEAPRTTVQRQRNGSARLKALGNAVVPAVVQPFAEAIYSVLKEQDSQAGAA